MMLLRDNIFKYISISVFFISFMFINYINVYDLEGVLFTPDITNEILFIKLIAETGQWLPEYFIPGYELFTNRAAYLGALLYYINGDVILSYKITFVILQVLLALMLYKLLKSINIDFEYRYLYMALLWSFGSFDALRVLIFKGYSYTLIYIYILLIMYIYINYENDFFYKKIILWISYIFTFYMALSGFRTFVYIVCPIFFYELIKVIINRKKTNKFILSLNLFVINVMGCLIFKIIFSKWVQIPSMSLDISNIRLDIFFYNIFNLFYRVIDIGNINIYASIVHFCFFLGFIFSLLKYKKMFCEKQKDIINILLLSIVLIILGNVVMGNKADTDSRYYISFILVVLLANIILLQKIFIKYNKFIGMNIGFVCFIILINYTINFSLDKNYKYNIVNLIPEYSVNHEENEKIVEYIICNKYKKVYGSFWRFNILPYYTNFNYFLVGSWWMTNHDLEPFYFVVDKRVFEKDNNKIAILLTDEELNTLSDKGKYKMKDAVFKVKIGDVNIYENKYNSMKILTLPHNKNEKQLYNISDMNFKGKIIDEKLVSLKSNADEFILYGPYINDNNLEYGEFIPKKNIYDIKLNYKILNDTKSKAYFDVAFNGGTVIKRQVLDKNSEECILQNVDLSNKKNIEFRVFKEKNVSMEISNIQIIKN